MLQILSAIFVLQLPQVHPTKECVESFSPKRAFPHHVEGHVPNDVMDVDAFALPCSIQELLQKHLGCLVHDFVVMLQAAQGSIV